MSNYQYLAKASSFLRKHCIFRPWSLGLDILKIFNLFKLVTKDTEQCLKHVDIKWKKKHSVNRGKRVLKTPLWHIKHIIFSRMQRIKYNDVHYSVISRLLKMTFILNIMTS